MLTKPVAGYVIVTKCKDPSDAFPPVNDVKVFLDDKNLEISGDGYVIPVVVVEPPELKPLSPTVRLAIEQQLYPLPREERDAERKRLVAILNEPTLRSGDVIYVNPKFLFQTVLEGGIYFFAHEGYLMAKLAHEHARTAGAVAEPIKQPQFKSRVIKAGALDLAALEAAKGR